MVVDDSVVIRRLVTHALEEDPNLEVVGAAANGNIALQKIPQLCPDVVTLDVEMPEMNGIETLRCIRKLHPHLVAIMFSTLTERGAAVTLEALSAGADDYVAKASNVGSLNQSMASLRGELIPKIKQFFPVETTNASRCSSHSPEPAHAVPFPRASAAGKMLCPRECLVIGVSTGGPTALAQILPLFPADFGLPVLVVQHMPPIFTQMLAESLQTKCRLRVEEAADGSPVEPGRIWIAPGGSHLRIVRRGASVLTALDMGPLENSCRPAVDVLFRSAAEVYGGGVIAAVLTGMGQDGLRGSELLRSAGAYILAQDEASSVVWGMPGFVAKAGLADAVVSLRDIVPEILMHC